MNKRKKLLVGIGFFVIYLFSLLLTKKDTGIFWDEPAYYESAVSYLAWFKNPSFLTIDKYWVDPGELHPPLEKVFQAASLEIFHNRLGIEGIVDSFKLPNMIIASLIVVVVYCFCLKYFGFITAFASALFLTVLPRFFGHAHFATMEIPLSFFILLALWFCWERLDKSLVIPGIFLGLAFLTKMTGVLFVIPLTLFLAVRAILRKKNIYRLALRLVVMIFVIFFLFIVFWPKIWVDPINRVIEFFSFYTSNQVTFLYFGSAQAPLPWHFIWVMIGITTPVLILGFSLIGIFSMFFLRQRRELKLFLLINLLFLPVLLSLPWVSAYDGIRLILPSLPILMIFAGLGVDFVGRFFRSKGRLIVVYTLLIVIFLNGLFMIKHYYPYMLSSYNRIVGGVAGAEKLGMEVQYSTETFRSTLPYINSNCPKNCNLLILGNEGPYLWYQKDGLLKKDIKPQIFFPFIPEDASLVVIPMRKSFFPEYVWNIFNNVKPVYSHEIDEVMVAVVYKMEDIQKHFGREMIY